MSYKVMFCKPNGRLITLDCRSIMSGQKMMLDRNQDTYSIKDRGDSVVYEVSTSIRNLRGIA